MLGSRESWLSDRFMFILLLIVLFESMSIHLSGKVDKTQFYALSNLKRKIVNLEHHEKFIGEV
jgi:hypothetical protein